MKRRTRIASTLALLLLFGCASPVAHVARGDGYVTGQPAYDEFFANVRTVRTQGLDSGGAERASHAGLIKALGLDENSSTAQVLEEASVRAKKLVQRGALLHLEITPEPHVIVSKGRGDLGADGDMLIRTIEEAARSALEMRRQLAALAERTADLSHRRVGLRAEALTAFRDAPKPRRDEVIFELDAAEGVLSDTSDAANRFASVASRFVVELAQAVETSKDRTGWLAHSPPLPQKAATSHGAKGRAAPPSARPPPPPGPPPPPVRKKGAKAADDFDP